MKTVVVSVLTACFAGLTFFPEDALAEDKKKKKKPDSDDQQQQQQPVQPRQTPPGVPQQRQIPQPQQIPAAPGTNGGLRSQPSNVAVRLFVSNLTGIPVDLVWVDMNGRQQGYGQVQPLQPGERPNAIDTYAGHVWLFKVSGRTLQTYTATAARQQTLTLGGGGGGGRVVIQNPVIIQNPVVIDAPRPAPIREVPAPIPDPAIGGGDRVPAAAAEFLQVHNTARAKVGVPALRWSDTLAKYAQAWANQLAASGSFQHRDQTKTGYGENLFGGSEGYTPGDAARHWLKEKADYNGEPVTAANFNSVGHYTQMVWSDSTEVGYGMAVGPNGVIVVANYSPGGNRNGKKPF